MLLLNDSFTRITFRKQMKGWNRWMQNKNWFSRFKINFLIWSTARLKTSGQIVDQTRTKRQLHSILDIFSQNT
jgi:hypothetical protein